MSYKIYGLADPRTNMICYIGMTRQQLKRRLSQHNNSSKQNPTWPIAKLSAKLRLLGRSFTIVELYECHSQQEMEAKEIQTIEEYRSKGYQLYNIQAGGQYNDNSNSPDSIRRQVETHRKNREAGKHIDCSGENNPTAVFTNAQVLEVYRLVRKFYSNIEIIQVMQLNCGNTVIQAIRSGQNYTKLWKENFTEMIPSIFMHKDGIPPRVKLKVVDLIRKGYELKHIGRHFPRVRGDLRRVVSCEIWKEVVLVYDKFYRVPAAGNSSSKPGEFGGTPPGTIPSQASNEEGVTTIPDGSTLK